jgi:hypothetical protein
MRSGKVLIVRDEEGQRFIDSFSAIMRERGFDEKEVRLAFDLADNAGRKAIESLVIVCETAPDHIKSVVYAMALKMLEFSSRFLTKQGMEANQQKYRK